MKRLYLAIAILLVCLASVSARAQTQVARWDSYAYTINSSSPQPGGLYPVLALPGSGVQICATWTAGTAACGTLATTYTDGTGDTACPTNAQLTSPLTSTCSGMADSAGGVGAWLPTGNYAYVITASYGAFGPYPFSVPGIGQCGAGCTIAGNLNVSGNGTFGGAVTAASVNTVWDLKAKFGAVGSNETMSCTATASSSSLTSCSGGDFANGQYVYIPQAGALPTISAPSAPTATCASDNGGSCTGTTVYCYEIAATQTGYYNPAMTAPSSATCVTQATQTAQSAIHNTAPDIYTAVSWTAISGAAQYAVYKSINSGPYSFYEVTPQTSIQDFNHAPSAQFTCSDLGYPCTAPSGQTASGIAAQITAVSGSTYTIAERSTQPNDPYLPGVSGSVTVQHDDSPAFLALYNALIANSGNGSVQVHIPTGNYVVHGYNEPANITRQATLLLNGLSDVTFSGDGPGVTNILPQDGAFASGVCGYGTVACQNAYFGGMGQGYSLADQEDAGSSQVTLSTPSQSSNFSSGQYVTIFDNASGYPQEYYGEINKVLAVNSTTGVLTLAYPLNKTYSATLPEPYSTCSSCSAAPMIYPISGGIEASNITFQNMTIRGPVLLFNYNTIDGLYFINDHLEGQGFQLEGQSRHIGIYNSRILEDPWTPTGLGGLIMAAAASSDIIATGDTYTSPHYSVFGRQECSEGSANIYDIGNAQNFSGSVDPSGSPNEYSLYGVTMCWNYMLGNNTISLNNTSLSGIFGGGANDYGGSGTMRNNAFSIDSVSGAQQASVVQAIQFGNGITSPYVVVGDNNLLVGSGASALGITTANYTSFNPVHGTITATSTADSNIDTITDNYYAADLFVINLAGGYIPKIDLGTVRYPGYVFRVMLVQPASGQVAYFQSAPSCSGTSSFGVAIDCSNQQAPNLQLTNSSVTIWTFYDDGTTVHFLGKNYKDYQFPATEALGSQSGNITISNFGTFGVASVNMTGNITNVNLSSHIPGYFYSLEFTQPASGGPYTLPSTCSNSGWSTGNGIQCINGTAPTVNPAAGSSTIISFYDDGTNTWVLGSNYGNTGTTYSGESPIVVSGTTISCPTCGTSTGSTVQVNSSTLGTANLSSTTGATGVTVSNPSGSTVNFNLATDTLTLGSTTLTLGGTTTSVSGLTVDGVSPTTMGYVDATSSIQTQLNGKVASTVTSLPDLTTAAGGAFGTGAYAAAYSLPAATTSALGGVKTDGSTISNSSGAISCTTATTSQLGCVKPDGTTITISGGVISSVSGGSGTVTDGSGTTTAGELLESSTTAHAYTLTTGLPNGTTATTQTTGDNTTKVATDAFVLANASGSGTVGSGTTGQHASYTGSGTAVAGSNLPLDVSQFSGSDIGAKINAAYAALPSGGGSLSIPFGSYSFSTPIVLSTSGKFVVLYGNGATLAYTGTTGSAITSDISAGYGDAFILHDLTISTSVSAATTTGFTAGDSSAQNSFYGKLDNVSITGFKVLVMDYAYGLEAKNLHLQNCSSASGSVGFETADDADDTHITGGWILACGTNMDITNYNPVFVTNMLMGTATTVDISLTDYGELHCTNCHLLNSSGTASFLSSEGYVFFDNSDFEDDATTGSTTAPLTSSYGTVSISNSQIYSAGETYTEFVDFTGTQAGGTFSGLAVQYTGTFTLYNASSTTAVSVTTQGIATGAGTQVASNIGTVTAAAIALGSGGSTSNCWNTAGTTTACSGGSSGLSGMTAGQVPIAATATTVTSSKALSGSGSGITTGPTSSTTLDVAEFTGTAGQIADSGTLLSSLAPKASPTFTGTVTMPLTTAGLVTSTSGGVISSEAVPTWNQSTTGNAATATAGQTRTTFTTSTSAVAANTCNSTVTIAMTGASSSSVFLITPTASTAAVTGWGSTGGLVLTTWGTSGDFQYQICNQTASSITPGAVTFNVVVF